MVQRNDRRVQRKARDIAHDARQTRALSDTEGEVLRDLLQSDETFAQLITAQQEAVAVAVKDSPHDEHVQTLAREGAAPLGEAIDDVIETHIERAQEIAALAEALAEPWGAAWKLYRNGFETPDAVRDADVHTLVAETNVAPALAERVVHGQAATVEDGSVDR
jgi:hypothetical protein